jgi:hypothetical protein
MGYGQTAKFSCLLNIILIICNFSKGHPSNHTE